MGTSNSSGSTLSYIESWSSPTPTGTSSLRNSSRISRTTRKTLTSSSRSKPETPRVLVVGLDGAGKTTIVYRVKLNGTMIQSIPTIGFNVENITHRKLEMNFWDVSGAQSLRPLWSQFYHGVNAILFVVDAAEAGDPELSRIDEARQELHALLSNIQHDITTDDEEYKKENQIAVLILANKQDHEGALSADQISDLMQVEVLENDFHVKTRVEPTSAVTGEGLDKSLDWLVKAIRSTY